MLNKSIAYRLSIYVSLAVISVFITFIVINYYFNKKLLKENIENEAIGKSSEIIMKVEKYVVSTEEITSNISEQIVFYGQNNNAELLVSTLMGKYKFLNAIYVNIDSGVPNLEYRNYMVFRDKDSIIFKKDIKTLYHCEAEEKIIDQIKNKTITSWTEPFLCPENQNVVVSFYSPIKFINKNNNISVIGEVICELSLHNLNDSVNSIKIGDEGRGFAFLVSKNGNYITHPRKELILTQNIFTISDDIYDKEKTNFIDILGLKLTGSMIAYPETLGSEKSWIYYTPIKEIEWSLIFVMPYNELYENLYLSLLKMLLFSVLGILVIFLIVTYITNKLIEPLSTVTSQLEKFSSLPNQNINGTLNEVKLVSQSLNYLKSRQEKYLANQKQEQLKNHQLKEDLLLASEVQMSLIKMDFPAFLDINEIDLFATYKPAKVVSGDLFDYFFIDNDNLLFTIGDVSGKGIPAAIFMSVAQTIIKNNAVVKKAKTIVNKTNAELFTSNMHQFFLTLFLGIFNVKTGVLNYCNAAHTSTFILKSNGNIYELNKSHGLPLGLYPDKKYSDSTVSIEKGDSIILFTDGVTELEDGNKLHFGDERFKENVSQLTGLKPKEMIKSIEKSLDIFKGEAIQSDDLTLLILKYNS
ncbi:MAG: SpoIIE family protein phosphatase [Prolixibacteraceae bacterium]|jgi:phosphoserine phosphatase RsbU/P|nr:SpoIIE family protein phosphatase [Prolixibacteraceae bacterium]MBT6006781.1 SpoIIE family protein phosphatase [Prolixibacteraceae bacterium]MBT6763229.1 SpoIIE family protein phosphatase [Prolixibacteraceae bacterium]MBT7000858.1 SpoIIE family protein phosphatase [Prolixibacteraceae bacterium]MBT7395342.1 SpoIIE family protein phosphatase [Prolixibacteraceae bacterium]